MSAISQVVLPAVATAVNPVPIMGVVALLGSRHPRRNAFTYLVVMALIMVTVAVIDVYVMKSVSKAQSDGSGGFQLLLGAVFLGVFVMTVRQRPAAGGASSEPKWMRTVDRISFFGAATLGVALVNYGLLSAAMSGILTSGASRSEGTTALVVYIVIALSTVIAPIVLYVVAPVRSRHVLSRLRAWLLRHNRVILMCVFGIMGGLFTAQGLVALLT
jgi:hypothetical protein